MNWDRVESQWEQRIRKAERHWMNIKDDEMTTIVDKREEFSGRLQKNFAIANEEAGEEIEKFNEDIDNLKESNSNFMRSQKAASRRENTSNRIASNSKSSARR